MPAHFGGPPNPYEQKIRAVIPTAARINIGSIELSNRVTKIQFEAQLPDGSWLTGTYEPHE